ncbi:hypothetical protein SDC9_112061 [bioreactor metagenome]|uniref:Uncharacterized protein n=1 Tax=bioreactor metagenome TaxID=1076179 RepID=A0A645BI70_9ZZZZ
MSPVICHIRETQIVITFFNAQRYRGRISKISVFVISGVFKTVTAHKAIYWSVNKRSVFSIAQGQNTMLRY